MVAGPDRVRDVGRKAPHDVLLLEAVQAADGGGLHARVLGHEEAVLDCLGVGREPHPRDVHAGDGVGHIRDVPRSDDPLVVGGAKDHGIHHEAGEDGADRLVGSIRHEGVGGDPPDCDPGPPELAEVHLGLDRRHILLGVCRDGHSSQGPRGGGGGPDGAGQVLPCNDGVLPPPE